MKTWNSVHKTTNKETKRTIFSTTEKPKIKNKLVAKKIKKLKKLSKQNNAMKLWNYQKLQKERPMEIVKWFSLQFTAFGCALAESWSGPKPRTPRITPSPPIKFITFQA